MNYSQIYAGMGGPTNSNGYGQRGPTPPTALNVRTNAGLSVGSSAAPLAFVMVAVAVGLALLYMGTIRIQGSRG
jgi:hypothetical protein